MAEATTGPARRWAADPLPVLGLLAAAGAVLVVWQLTAGGVPWQAPALLGVVASGLALSGST